MPVSRTTTARVVFLTFALSCAVDEREPLLAVDNPGAPESVTSGASGSGGAAGPDDSLSGAPGSGGLPGTPSTPDAPPSPGESGAGNAGDESNEGIDDVPLAPIDTAPSESTTPSGTPGLSVAPALLDFTGVEVGTSSTRQTLTVRNVGRAPTGPLAIDDTAAGPLGVSNGCSAGLDPGEECQVQVQLTPAVAGLVQATLGVGNDVVGFADVQARGEGRFRLSVELTGRGGRVSSADGARVAPGRPKGLSSFGRYVNL